MLEVDIYKDFGNFILDVDFKTEDGVLGLLGASGSGKSLSLKCIAGLVRPDRGRIVLNGRVLFDSEKKINLKVQDRRVGYLFQDYALFPNMTVYENIKVGIRARKIDSDFIVNKKLEEMKLVSVKNKKPNEISGGEKQRTALARILVNEPDLLLLDEPYSAIDSYLKWKIELDIKETIEKYKIPTLFVSHDRDEVYRMCHAIVAMKDGKSEEIKETKELFRNPLSLSAAELSGCKNFSILKKEGDGSYLALDWGLSLSLKSFKACDLVGMRSHYIEILEDGGLENSYPMELLKEIEELFNFCLLVRPKDSKFGGSLRIDIEKDKWQEMRNKKNLYFHIDEKDLIYLKK